MRASGAFHAFCGVRPEVVPFLTTLWTEIANPERSYLFKSVTRQQYSLLRICFKFNQFLYKPLCIPNLISEARRISHPKHFTRHIQPLLRKPIRIQNHPSESKQIIRIKRQWNRNVKQQVSSVANLRLLPHLRQLGLLHTSDPMNKLWVNSFYQTYMGTEVFLKKKNNNKQ
jgi:hypothetical protein